MIRTKMVQVIIPQLAQGLSAKPVADVLRIRESTVRSHLQHVFGKTRTTRQNELLQMLQNAAWLIHT